MHPSAFRLQIDPIYKFANLDSIPEQSFPTENEAFGWLKINVLDRTSDNRTVVISIREKQIALKLPGKNNVKLPSEIREMLESIEPKRSLEEKIAEYKNRIKLPDGDQRKAATAKILCLSSESEVYDIAKNVGLQLKAYYEAVSIDRTQVVSNSNFRKGLIQI